MTRRLAKTFLVFGVALIYTLVVFNNLTDYDTNYQFVRHTLMMDSTFPGNHDMWRAINQPTNRPHTLLHIDYRVGICGDDLMLVGGGVRLLRSRQSSATKFRQSSNVAIAGLAVGLLMSLVAFLSVGGEWFLMWQLPTWSGQQAAFRMFTVDGIVLIVLLQADTEEQI